MTGGELLQELKKLTSGQLIAPSLLCASLKGRQVCPERRRRGRKEKFLL
jgi:hypothetical protein